MINRIPRLSDATTREQRGPFSVVSQLVTVRGKATRHILIFDDHPATLQLVRSFDLLKRAESKLGQKAFAIALILSTGIGMIWILF